MIDHIKHLKLAPFCCVPGMPKEAEKESPPPDESKRKGKRGRLKRTKSRNLLERVQNFEEDVLMFLDNEIVPFTNNLGEMILE